MDRNRRWALLLLSLVATASALSCSGGGGEGRPGPANVTGRGYAGIMEYLLSNPDLLPLGEDIEAICVGLDEDGLRVPDAEFFQGFEGSRPPLRAYPACVRTMAPGGDAPVIRIPGGAEAILITMSSRDDLRGPVDVTMEASGQEPRHLACEFRVVFGPARRAAIPVQERGALRGRPMRWTDMPLQVRRCS